MVTRKEKFDFLYASHHEHMEKTYTKALKDVKKTQQNHHRNEMEYHDDAILAFSSWKPLSHADVHFVCSFLASLCIAQDCILYSKALL